jgi:predicted enzyme related to lactoylglutathione lyase
MIIDKIALISLPVSDQDRAKTFYIDKLGFTATADYIMDTTVAGTRAGNRWISLVPPGGGVPITLTTWFEDLKPGAMKMSLSTPDVQAAYEALRAKGVEPNNDVTESPWGRWFSIDDPDGNNWLIVQTQ